MSKYNYLPFFRGGWFVEIETLKGTWAKVEWSLRKEDSVEYAEALNRANEDFGTTIARVKENKRKK